MQRGRKVNKIWLMRTVTVFAVFGLLYGAWGWMEELVKDKTMTGTSQLYNFHQLEKDTVDVLLIGSSHTYYTVNTCMLFDRYGIPSYDMGSGGQPIWISYYYLKEALKTQKPQLVLCDIFTIYRSEKETEDAALRGLINLKPSLDKWEAIKASNYNGKFHSAGIFLNFPYMHTRYKELTESDFLNYSRENYLGYAPRLGVSAQVDKFDGEIPDAASITESQPVIPRAEEYLRKFCELCKKEEIPLLLINTPYFGLTEENQKAYNYAAAVAEEYGVSLLDGNKYVDEIGIIWTEDAYDTSHLNYQGSLKYTKWLGEYLCANYALEDRSGDLRYRRWADESARLYHDTILKDTLKQIEDVEMYFRELRENEDLVIAATLTGNWDKLEGTISELMKSLHPGWNGENALLLDGENVVFSAGTSEKDYREHFDCGRVVFEFSQKSGEVTIRSNEEDYACVKSGINLIVYDKVAEAVIDRAYFASTKGLVRKQ